MGDNVKPKRADYNVHQKLEIYKDFTDCKVSIRHYCKNKGITRSVLQRIIAEHDKLTDHHETMTVNSNRKRQRQSTLADIDEALVVWFRHARNCNAMLSGPIIRAKAEKLAENLGHENWKCSDGWFSRWKIRHNISYKVSRCLPGSLGYH